MELKKKTQNPGDPKNWVDLLPEMLDKYFMIMGNQEKLIYFEFIGAEVMLLTNSSGFKKKRTIALEDLSFELSKWLPIEREPDSEKGITTYKQQISSSVLSEVKDILMANIKSVQADKNYIPQAVEVRESADKIIDLAKVEIDYMRTLNKLNS